MREDVSFKHFFKYSTEFLCALSREGQLIALNPAFETALGYDLNDLQEITFLSLIHPDDQQRTLDYLDTLVEGKAQLNLRNRFVREDGSFFSIEWRCTYSPEEDTIYGIGHKYITIDEMQQQLHESEQRYQTLIEGASIAMIVIDVAGIIQLINPRTSLLFGYDTHELIGKHFHLLLPGTVRDKHSKLEDNYWMKPANRPMGHGSHFTALRKDGSEFAADIALSHIEIDNDPHVVAFVSDLSDRLEADRLQQELEKEKELRHLKSRFLSMVAHDFRTPLTLIMSTSGMLRMMEGKITPEKRIEQLNKIDHQVNTLSQLLDEVSFINKNELGGYRLDLMPVDICIFLQQKAEELQNAYQKPLHFTVNCSPTNVRFLLDELLINKIFSNLISNAIKYSSAETGEVTIHSEVLEDWVKISIRDNGIGIPEKDQRYIFEAFHRAENVGSIKGSGLGLMIVKQSVEAHGGRIEFTSTEGAGTMFTVYLPSKPIS